MSEYPAVRQHRALCGNALKHAQHADYSAHRGAVNPAGEDLVEACRFYRDAYRLCRQWAAPEMQQCMPAVRDYIRTVAKRIRAARDLRGSMLAPLVHAV